MKKTKYNWLGRAISVSLLVVLAIPLLLLSQEVKLPISNALDQGDTTKAISLLEEDIGMDPSFEYNYYVLGNIYMKQKKYNEALEQFEIAIKKDKKFYEGLYALGLVQLKLGKIEEAEKNFKNGLKKSKKMKAEFHNGIGLVKMALGELNEADKEIRQAIVIDSTNA
ncbi:MAG: tetratricopeptide repeat protein, partial [candidate division Zixibacteria bacterium]|nr:tetratricopeptide repeat protein [candidate division Zixibacteria bacterium]